MLDAFKVCGWLGCASLRLPALRANPTAQGLARKTNLDRDRRDRSPVGEELVLMCKHFPSGSLAHFREILRRFVIAPASDELKHL